MQYVQKPGVERERRSVLLHHTHSRGAAAPLEKKEEYSSVCVPFLLCGRVRGKLFHLLSGRVGAELGLLIQEDRNQKHHTLKVSGRAFQNGHVC